MAPVILALREASDFDVTVVVTAQHREMLDSVFETFDIIPDADLDVMRHSQTPTSVAAAVLSGLESLVVIQSPDWVLVQGDTTTAMAASMAAHYARVRVGHVEAGLRTQDRANPFPEETNRVLIAHLADLHFAPTAAARENLVAEGISRNRVAVTGNTVIDALLSVAGGAWQPAEHSPLLGLPTSKRWILVTAHRRESFGRPIREICAAIRAIAARGDVAVVYPVHPNPNIAGPVSELLTGYPGVHLLDPLDYPALVWLMVRCHLVLTDSGGIQEEAPSLGKPVLVLRDTTERPEAVGAGVAQVVGTRARSVERAAHAILDDDDAYGRMARPANPYGDGRATLRILDALRGDMDAAEWSGTAPAHG